jgi:hypothetical protein
MQAADMVNKPRTENWKQRFDDTILTPEGRKIKTLGDARDYLVTFAIPRKPEKKLMLTNALRSVLGAANGTERRNNHSSMSGALNLRGSCRQSPSAKITISSGAISRAALRSHHRWNTRGPPQMRNAFQ